MATESKDKKSKGDGKLSVADMLEMLNAGGPGSGSAKPSGAIKSNVLDDVLDNLDALAAQKPDAAQMIAKMKADLKREFGGVASRAGVPSANKAQIAGLPPSVTAPAPPGPAPMAVPGGA